MIKKNEYGSKGTRKRTELPTDFSLDGSLSFAASVTVTFGGEDPLITAALAV